MALIFAAAIAVTLASYLQLAQTTLRVAHRAHYANVALNLAETGLERGMLAIAKAVEDPDYPWAGWMPSADGKDMLRIFDGFAYEANVTGLVRVRVQDYKSAGTPAVLARSTLTLPNGEPIEKWVRVSCGKTSPFGNAMIAERVTIRGSGLLNSYSSSAGAYGVTLADGSTNRNDGLFVGAAVLECDPSSSGTVIVEGSVAVASEDGLKLGDSARIGPSGASGIDERSVRYDFTKDYEDADAPAIAGHIIASITSSTTLPRPGDVSVTVDGRPTYYYTVTEGIFLTDDGAQLTIGEVPPGPPPGVDVVIVVLTKLQVTGTGAGIRIAGSDTLSIYAAGDVTIAGAGVAAEGRPAQFQLWGTRPQSEETPQVFNVVGNDGEFRGVIYAPNADVTIAADSSDTAGHISGAIVAREVKIASGSFHYDEDLRDLYKQYAFRVTDWEELATADQRTAVAEALSF